MSLDGYIAKDNDNIDFLSIVESSGEDYGYSAFQKETDTLIWGRKTYHKFCPLALNSHTKTKKCFVLSRTKKVRR